jgi:hypothetical protein
MRIKNRVICIIILFIIVGFIYILFFLLDVESISLFLFLTIGSVAVLSTGTIYTIVQSKDNSYEYLRKKKAMLLHKYPLQKKTLKKSQTKEFIEDYFEANPLVDSYADSNESYEDIPKINDYIFSVFSQEELEKISQLSFSKMDKIFLIRELLYFDPTERNQLIEAMIKNSRNVDDSIIYTPPNKIFGIDDKIRIYVRSLVEPSEKTKIIIIETTEFINIFKQNIGVLFDYNPDKFLISSGGILLDEALKINDYNIEDDDEIALIPVRKKDK